MLQERDWVMKLVKQAAEFIARALKLVREQKPDQAVIELEAACGKLLGMDFAALALVDSASAADMLREPVKILAFAQLLEAMAQAHQAAGDELKALSRAQHALELALEALGRRDSPEARALVERLRPQVDESLLPARAVEALARLG